MTVAERFAKNLKLMLKEKGINNVTFAEMVGVTDSCVSKWIYAQREPTLSNLYKITKVLDCTFDELVE